MGCGGVISPLHKGQILHNCAPNPDGWYNSRAHKGSADRKSADHVMQVRGTTHRKLCGQRLYVFPRRCRLGCCRTDKTCSVCGQRRKIKKSSSQICLALDSLSPSRTK